MEKPKDSRVALKVPRGREALVELALNVRWTWNHGCDALWEKLDPERWSLTHQPFEVLQKVAPSKLDAALADPDFCAEIDRLMLHLRTCETAPAWFQLTHPESTLTCVAYFCLEFMLTEALPIYSGGLGNVAGDQLKAASDLGVPIVGVGLLYQHGYFRQVIDREGAQQATYPYHDPTLMPITPLRQADGTWLRVHVMLPSGPVWLRAWQVRVGRVKLYLLDADDPSNGQEERLLTSHLYGAGAELRIQQELLLGVGGWRLLRALGLRPEICHLNEGHAAFAILERARDFMCEHDQPFGVALTATRAGNVFTTHTAVAAGFDRFSPELMQAFLGSYARQQLRIPLAELLGLGRQNAEDGSEPFNMAYLAVRGAGTVNGVSALHGKVSRRLFGPLFPQWPSEEVPIGHVTNGVHMPTWDSKEADALWTKACGKARWAGLSPALGEGIRRVSDEELWTLRTMSRGKLVDYARIRVAQQMASAGDEATAIADAQSRLKPHALTLGFARRFATYKRPNLLLRDPARLKRMLSNPERPIQLLVAGKAHPADQAGQALIQEWTRWISQSDPGLPVVFLADYDMQLAEHLVQGIDVWLNTPRRPWEACGTSGMKVLVNGGLNFSELDGWWAEAYQPDVGWALGDGREPGDDSSMDEAEGVALYERLEQEVIPQFFSRDGQDRPVAWLAKIRESMARLTPRYSATRTVRDYTEQRYLPGAAAYRRRAAGHGAEARVIADWQRGKRESGTAPSFVEVLFTPLEHQQVVTARIFLGKTSPATIKVELYADAEPGGLAVRQEMAREETGSFDPQTCLYQASVSTTRPASDFTVRIRSSFPDVSVPLEAGWIVWHR